MGIEERLKRAFPGHLIEMKQLPDTIGIGTYSIFYDRNELRIRFQDWSELIWKWDHRDVHDEEFQKLVAEIKLELSRLAKSPIKSIIWEQQFIVME